MCIPYPPHLVQYRSIYIVVFFNLSVILDHSNTYIDGRWYNVNGIEIAFLKVTLLS